jgi:ribosomal protein L37E
MSARRLFSEAHPCCRRCGVANQFHAAEVAEGRCDNLVPEGTAFLDGFAEATQGDLRTGLAMMAQVTEWTDPADLEKGLCPKCGEPEFYVKVPRGCDACGYEEPLSPA